MRHALLCASILVAFGVFTTAAFAQDDPLITALDGLRWGDSAEDVVVHHETNILEDYRLEIAGVNDPLEIDRLRRAADVRVREIADSHEVFDGPRTGYEVSVLRGEIAAGAGQSMLTVRDAAENRYYVFHGDALKRVVVAYDQASLNYLSFETFVERLESVFGPPGDTAWERDDIGVNHLTHAAWENEATRIRAEERSEIFASFLIVYEAAELPAAAAAAGPARTGRPTIGGMMDRHRSDHAGRPANDSVVDNIIGGPSGVELNVREVDDEDEGSGEDMMGSAFDEEEDLEALERLERPSSRDRQAEEEEEEEEQQDDAVVF